AGGPSRASLSSSLSTPWFTGVRTSTPQQVRTLTNPRERVLPALLKRVPQVRILPEPPIRPGGSPFTEAPGHTAGLSCAPSSAALLRAVDGEPLVLRSGHACPDPGGHPARLHPSRELGAPTDVLRPRGHDHHAAGTGSSSRATSTCTRSSQGPSGRPTAPSGRT